MIVIPPPLAEYAHDARTAATCPRCKHGRIGVGQRIAQLPGGQWVHTWCVPAMPATGRPARLPKGTP